MSHLKQYIWQQPNWPRLSANQPEVSSSLIKAHQCHSELIGKMKAIGLHFNAAIQDALINTVIATSAIEGELLSPESVRSSVMRKLGLSDDLESPVNRHVDGLVEITQDALNGQHVVLGEDRLLRWHSALFPTGVSGIRRIAIGRYRDHVDAMQIVSGGLGKEVVHFTAPPSHDVRSEMERFIDWFARSAPTASTENHEAVDGIMRAAIAHLWFETIHPFEDGNGRIGRAIMDLALAQALGPSSSLYSLSSQLLKQRRAYYDLLNQAQCGGLDVSSWVIWFCEVFSAAGLSASLSIDNSIKVANFWRQHHNHTINQRQKKVLQKLLNFGNAGFVGGLSAEKYIAMTSVSKATATRDLSQLVEQGFIFSSGQGKATRYYVNVSGWDHGLHDLGGVIRTKTLDSQNLDQFLQGELSNIQHVLDYLKDK
jgi:Fic family protein